jgi:UDP-N-acetylglucosamine:LPS N-acetylglucosamine transferase
MSILNKRLVKLEEQQAAKFVVNERLSPQQIVNKIENLFRILRERQSRIDAGLESYVPNTSGVDAKALAAKICGMYELAKIQVGNEY